MTTYINSSLFIKSFFILMFYLSGAFFSSQLFSNSNPSEKIAIIIPGLKEYPDKSAYQQIKKAFEQQNYTTYILYINWDEITLNNLVQKGNQVLDSIISRHSHADITLFGFSFGAVIALKNAYCLEVKKIILASLSPIFKEDITYHTTLFKFFIKFNTNYNINNLYYPENISKPIIFFYGNRDSLLINENIINMRNLKFPGSKLIIIKNARHNISGKDYQSAIQNYIKTL